MYTFWSITFLPRVFGPFFSSFRFPSPFYILFIIYWWWTFDISVFIWFGKLREIRPIFRRYCCLEMCGRSNIAGRFIIFVRNLLHDSHLHSMENCFDSPNLFISFFSLSECFCCWHTYTNSHQWPWYRWARTFKLGWIRCCSAFRLSFVRFAFT